MKRRNKITLTKGLISSGKTTWANNEVDRSNGQIININKDDLRAMLHNSKHSKGREDFVIKVQEVITELALKEGKDVVWSDTNLNTIHETRAANKFGDNAEIIINDSFLSVSLKDCIERDSKRANPVGEKAIRQMYTQYLKKDPEILIQDESLPKALIVDLDSTLTTGPKNRSPYEWLKVKQDIADPIISDIVRDYYNLGYKIIIVSGRDEICLELSKEWLLENNIPFSNIFLRPLNDSRKDSVVKEEIFNNFIRNKYYIKFVLDDRAQVVEIWRRLGLKCLQVAEGNF